MHLLRHVKPRITGIPRTLWLPIRGTGMVEPQIGARMRETGSVQPAMAFLDVLTGRGAIEELELAGANKESTASLPELTTKAGGGVCVDILFGGRGCSWNDLSGSFSQLFSHSVSHLSLTHSLSCLP
jgi:hypothetical protein